MLWRNLQDLRAELVSGGWKTPCTYAREFSEAGNFPAVYLFALVDREDHQRALVAYVGMSICLKRRWDTHNILPELEACAHWPMRWFRRMDRAALREAERALIHRFDPPWNIVGRRRGVLLS